MKRQILIGTVIGIGVVAAVALSRTMLWPVSIHLEPAQARPGSTITLQASFARSSDYNFFSVSESNLEILSEKNKNIFFRLDKLLTDAGISATTGSTQAQHDQAINAVADSIDSRIGFIADQTYQQLVQRRTNRSVFLLESTSNCPVVDFSNPNQPLKNSYRYILHILPKTPVGTYTIHVKKGFYCNGLPRSTTTLKLTVL